MKVLRSPLILLLTVFLTACEITHHTTGQQVAQVNPMIAQNIFKGVYLAKPISSVKVEAIALEKEALERVRDISYSSALKNLRFTSQNASDENPIIQTLLKHPNQTLEMFEGCGQIYLNDSQSHAVILNYYQEFPRMIATRFYAIAPKKHLISMTCWVAGYWMTTANYIYDEAENPPQVKQLSVPIYDTDTAQLIPSLVSRGFQHYQEETHVLTVGRKYSGAGDCGFRATYFREHKKCSDGILKQPDEFPRVYP
jgi:hypothetical protein